MGPNGAMTPPLPCLVDSGADSALFPIPYAALFGIDLGSCKVEQGGDAGGGSDRYIYPDPINAHFEGRIIPLTANFGGPPFVLLGRQDIFSAFRQIAFNEKGRFFSISD